MGIHGVSRHSVRKVMVFIDGNYLRTELRNLFDGDDRINYHVLGDNLRQWARYLDAEPHLVRAYYYDAIWEIPPSLDSDDTEEYHKQKAYLEKIEDTDLFEVRKGRIRDGKREREQKGVDVLISIDMISKAYENHYDVAVLVSGDDDLLDVVKTVKNSGKNVMGAFFPKSISKRLRDSFDFKHIFSEGEMKNMRMDLSKY